MKFRVFVAGDSSVGLWDINATVTFDDQIVWGEDMLADAKQHLADFYDTPISSVLTEEEYTAELIHQKNIEARLYIPEGFDEWCEAHQQYYKSECPDCADIKS